MPGVGAGNGNGVGLGVGTGNGVGFGVGTGNGVGFGVAIGRGVGVGRGAVVGARTAVATDVGRGKARLPLLSPAASASSWSTDSGAGR